MIHADPTTWPLDELLDEIAAMRSLRDQLADAGWLAAPATVNACEHFSQGRTGR